MAIRLKRLLKIAVPLSLCCGTVAPAFAALPELPLNGVFTGKQGKNHLQGIAVDERNGWIYYSFTTRLVKGDLQGNILGSVEGLVGHLGCIAFCPEDGCVYGSLEFKKDSIGADILHSLGDGREYEDGFYVAVFDTAQITRMGMSAEADGVMTAAFLPEVLDDYAGKGENGRDHRCGCSGIDGLCFAPKPGDPDGPKKLWVAYGVYSDLLRSDNDHQVLLCYDRETLRACAAPLRQTDMHRQGPDAPEKKYFAFTGNTTYGVQNLEYDPVHRLLLMAVYRGHKPQYANFDMFAADLTKPARAVPLKGLGETGAALTLWGADAPESDDVAGWRDAGGQCGMHVMNDGSLLVAETVTVDGENAAYIKPYTFDPETGLQPKAAAANTRLTVWQRILRWIRAIVAAVKGWFGA
ncbi:MAG: hypothetical protein IJK89_02000 [Clostridia bacterium]|nr:hypothetical protein [Clostridia bacterium]